MRRAKFGRGGAPGRGQSPQRFIAIVGALQDFAGDVSPSCMFFAPDHQYLACSFQGDFHIRQGSEIKAICNHGRSPFWIRLERRNSPGDNFNNRSSRAVCPVSDSGTRGIHRNEGLFHRLNPVFVASFPAGKTGRDRRQGAGATRCIRARIFPRSSAQKLFEMKRRLQNYRVYRKLPDKAAARRAGGKMANSIHSGTTAGRCLGPEPDAAKIVLAPAAPLRL